MKKNDDILKALAEDVINVTFTKVDGSKRTMKCTRNLKKIPSSEHPKNGLSMNEDVISVYEIDNCWRSFRADSVIKWKKA